MPDSLKATYKIGEISKILKIPTYVLRYWETEFSELKPEKTATGQRKYTDKDLELVKRIARYRYEEKMTVDGTKAKLNAETVIQPSPEFQKSLQLIKNGLQEILAALG